MQPPFVGFDLPPSRSLSLPSSLPLLLFLILTLLEPSSKVNDWVSSLMCLGINCMQILLLFCFFFGDAQKLQLKCQFHFICFLFLPLPFLCFSWLSSKEVSKMDGWMCVSVRTNANKSVNDFSLSLIKSDLWADRERDRQTDKQSKHLHCNFKWTRIALWHIYPIPHPPPHT